MEIQSTNEMSPYFTMTKCNKFFITYLTRSTDGSYDYNIQKAVTKTIRMFSVYARALAWTKKKLKKSVHLEK